MSDSRDRVIFTRGLARSFGATQAVVALDLEVRRGELYGLVGPDGAGKSTAIRLLCGLLKPQGGTGTVLGCSLETQADALKARIGYLSQNFTLYGDLSVDENIEFFAELHGVPDYHARAEELLDFTRLKPFRTRLAQALSGGMKKKLALACTLIHTPDLIFLDEPSTGVDPVSRGEFWVILDRVLEQGVTVLMTSPYLDEAERCHRISLMHAGRIVTSGTPDEVKALMPGKVFALGGPDAPAAYHILRERWPATQVVLYGDQLRFWTPRGEPEALEAQTYITQRGLGPVTHEPVAPSLEDAFVGLLHEEPKGGPGAPRAVDLELVPPSRVFNSAAITGPVIVADGLTKRFGDFVAVDNLSFAIQRGEIFGFLGPNGAGKSTTIRMLCGLLTPSEGQARVGGYEVGRDPERVRENIGYMSQKFSLYRDLTVRENLAFFGGVYGLDGDRLEARSAVAMDMAGLHGLEDRLTGTLSGAHQQRLALGCAILHEPPILFLDEPTSGVDPISRRMFWDLIQAMAARGVTILVTTHFMDEAEFCGRIGFINGGRLVALDRPAALKRSVGASSMWEVFLRLASREPVPA